MNHQPLINQLADEADELLNGARSRGEARELLLDRLRQARPALPDAARQQAADAVLRILDAEDFFNATPGDDPSDPDDDTPENADAD
jgi:hypothetical protein